MTDKQSNTLMSDKVIKAAKADKRNRGDLERIHIEPAANGFMVASHYHPKTEGKGAIYPDPEKNVFSDHKAAADHISSLLAAYGGGGKGKDKS